MLMYRGETEAQGEGEICPRTPREWAAEQELERSAVGSLWPSGVRGSPTLTRHGVPLPVPTPATEVQDWEESEGDEDQDEGQAPCGQHFRATRKEKGALACGRGKLEARERGQVGPGQCMCSAPEAHCLGENRGRGADTG